MGEQRLRIEKMRSMTHLKLNIIREPSSQQTPGTSPGRQGGHNLSEAIGLALLLMALCVDLKYESTRQSCTATKTSLRSCAWPASRSCSSVGVLLSFIALGLRPSAYVVHGSNGI